MPSDVYMPALGMSQDTGVIAEWLKQPGDPVAEGDALMSVETDKAVQEIEATSAGFLGEILFAAGAEVPVGEVVARIVADASAVSSSDTPKASAPSAPQPEPEVAPSSAASTESQPTPKPAPVNTPSRTVPASAPAVTSPSATSRPLASPKAKRLAQERGIDMAVLWQQCEYRPVLAADVENYREPAPGAVATTAATPATPAATVLSLSVPTTHLLAFCQWLEEPLGEPASVGLVSAWLLAKVWRQHTEDDEPLHVDITGYANRQWTQKHIPHADQGGLMALWQRQQEADPEHPAPLTVMDFTRSSIRSVSSHTITSNGCTLSFDSHTQESLNLSVVSTTLPIETLAPMADELATLLAQPLNVLLH